MSRALIALAALCIGCSDVESFSLGAEPAEAGVDDCNDLEFARMLNERFTADGGIRAVCMLSPFYVGCPAREAVEYISRCGFLRSPP